LAGSTLEQNVLRGAEKVFLVILSEAKNLSLFLFFTIIEERFFASLRMTGC
jgi:hypothetical protein